jgi:hypothetical protein
MNFHQTRVSVETVLPIYSTLKFGHPVKVCAFLRNRPSRLARKRELASDINSSSGVRESLCPPLGIELYVGTIIHTVPTASTYNTKVYLRARTVHFFLQRIICGTCALLLVLLDVSAIHAQEAVRNHSIKHQTRGARRRSRSRW